MSGDHNQFQKPKSYLDDMNEVRKALEMALMALEDANDMFSNDCSVEDVYADEIEALTKVLEKKSFECPRCGHCCQADQPTQQEPVAWMHTTGTGHVYFRKKPQDKVFNPQPVFTSPPKREWVSEALRLADALDAEFVQGRISNSTGRESAVELRRLALKQWVSLTDEEIDILSCEMVKGDKSVNWLCKVLEAKLKEKNGG
jgi:hypothetical protein